MPWKRGLNYYDKKIPKYEKGDPYGPPSPAAKGREVKHHLQKDDDSLFTK